ncbi:MAG: DNA internalization-related competence protein ComEC/Rec2 [Myxococcales bacterium]|nr:DNA internalization-related competence protein ComEC/Rec2 [Myxococcales bacterium]
MDRWDRWTGRGRPIRQRRQETPRRRAEPHRPAAGGSKASPLSSGTAKKSRNLSPRSPITSPVPPLTLLAVAFAVGIALREAALFSPLVTGAAVAITSCALLAAWRRRRRFGLAVLAQALALGALAAATARPGAPAGLLDGGVWEVAARVEEPPERIGGRAHVLLGLETVARGGVVRAARGRVWLSVGGEPVEPLLPGDAVRFRARLLAPHGFQELESPDPRRRLAARGVIAVAGVPDPAALVRIERPAPSGVARVVAGWRSWLLARVRARLSGDRLALFESLVLGERGDVPKALDDAFRVAGVSHVLSVSGLHLAIAAFLLFVGLRWLLARCQPLARRVAVRRIAALAALPATLLYTLLTGGAVATVRSCVAAWVWLFGIAIERPATAAGALGTAALLLLGASPLALYDPSFQLSFAAAIGGVALAPRGMALVEPFFPARGRARFAVRLLAALVVASAAAIAATAPLTAWHFAQVAPSGLWANPIVVPLAEVWVLPVGLLGCCLAPLSPSLSGWLIDLAGVGAEAMAAVVRWIASWAPSGRVPAPTLVEGLLWYGALAGLAVGGRRGRRAAALLAILCGAAIGGRALAPRLFPRLAVTFLDIGQGDATLVELPGGKTLLIDGGGSFDPAFDPGAQVIVPWLERRGVRRIDIVVLTHPHPDHANGLAAVVDRFPVGEVWTNGAPSELPGLLRLVAAAARRGARVVRPHRIADHGAVIDVLHPLQDGVVRVPTHRSENDGSIVLRVEWAERAVLLCGDIEAWAERRLLTTGAKVAADVVKAPHHGSPTSSTARFVAAVHPSLVVFTAGANNRWGFPARAVEERWQEVGARTFRTDLDGAVRVTIAQDGEMAVEAAIRR